VCAGCHRAVARPVGLDLARPAHPAPLPPAAAPAATPSQSPASGGAS
jgi:hypothetical protein